MSDTNVHYEVSLSTKGAWRFHGAFPEKQGAIYEAQQLIKRSTIDAVKVTEERFDPASGLFRERVVFSDGEPVKRSARKHDTVAAPLNCWRIEDIYSYEGRRTIRQLLGPELDRLGITPTELIHHPGHVEAIEDAGTQLQHAVQRVAIAQAQETDQSAAQRTKELYKLIAQATERLKAETAGNAIPKITPSAFPFTLKTIARKPARRFTLFAALAVHLERVDGWGAKLDTLLVLCEELPPEENLRKDAVAALDQLVAERIEATPRLDELVGPKPALGESLMGLLDIFLGTLPKTETEPPARLVTLTKLVAGDELDATRGALARILLKELRSARPLTAEGLDGEVRFARRLAARMERGLGNILRVDEMIEAFSVRSARFVQGEAIAEYLADADTPFAAIDRLLGIEKNVIGAANKKALAQYLMPLLGGREHESYFTQADGSPIEGMRRLAGLQKKIVASDLERGHKDQLSAQCDIHCLALMRKTNLVERLAKAVDRPLVAGMRLLGLVEDGVLTMGEAADTARMHAVQLLRKDPAALKAHVRDLLAEAPNSAEAETALRILKTAGVAGGARPSPLGDDGAEAAAANGHAGKGE